MSPAAESDPEGGFAGETAGVAGMGDRVRVESVDIRIRFHPHEPDRENRRRRIGRDPLPRCAADRPEPEKGFGRCPVGLADRAGRRRVQDSVGGRPSVDPASSKRFHEAYRFSADEVTEKAVAKECVGSGRHTPGRVIGKSE